MSGYMIAGVLFSFIGLIFAAMSIPLVLEGNIQVSLLTAIIGGIVFLIGAKLGISSTTQRKK